MIKVAFYDAKAYDRPSFEHYGSMHNIRFLIQAMEEAREAIKNDRFLEYAAYRLEQFGNERGC